LKYAILCYQNFNETEYTIITKKEDSQKLKNCSIVGDIAVRFCTQKEIENLKRKIRNGLRYDFEAKISTGFIRVYESNFDSKGLKLNYSHNALSKLRECIKRVGIKRTCNEVGISEVELMRTLKKEEPYQYVLEKAGYFFTINDISDLIEETQTRLL
jgi:hypothetical protein